MKKITKVLSSALALTMCAGVAFGAVACGEEAAEENKDVTLVIWMPSEDRPFAEAVTDKFQEAHPEKNYTFLFGEQPESDAGTAVLNDVSNAPDIFCCASDHLRKLYNGGALNRLGGSMLDRLNEQIDAKAMTAATLDVAGDLQTYGIPYTDNTYFLYYNKKELDASDVTTIDGILAKCRAPKTNGEDDVGTAFGYPMNDGWYSSAFLFGAGVTYSVEYDKNFGETLIETNIDTAGVEPGKAMAKYSGDARFKPDSNDSKIVAGFEDGSMIAGVSGIWNLKSLEEAIGAENLGVAALPTYTLNGQQTPLKAFAGYKLMCVCNYSAVKADALALAEYFSSYESQMLHYEMRGYTPTNKQAKEDETIKADPFCIATMAVLQNSQTADKVPTTWWTPLESFGNALVTSGGATQVEAQLSAAAQNIRKYS